MMVLFYIALAFLLTYGILMNYYRLWWKQIPEWTADNIKKAPPATRLSVIIAARNEERNIRDCLKTLLQQQYPAEMLEIIVVDDNSSDPTAAIVESMQSSFLKLIRLKDYNPETVKAPKKRAIEQGIEVATGELIVTTDADCSAGNLWLSSIAAYYQHSNNIFIAAPVKMKDSRSLLSKFQALDFLTMQGITGASVFKRFHNMCNGANLAYERKLFYEMSGFSGIDQIASGDDMLLMHKIAAKYPLKVGFLKSKEAIVATEPAADWKEFFYQRVRWASKATHYNHATILFVLSLVYITNLLLASVLLLSIWHPVALLVFLLLCVIKFVLEIFFVKEVAQFFDQSHLLPFLLLLQPLHIVYIVISGFLGQFQTYEWKGRKLK